MSVRSFFPRLRSPDQMQRIDRVAIEEMGIPSLDLMEAAGRGAADVIARIYRERGCKGRILVLCGAGNNGGDGLVAARCLRRTGFDVRVVVLAPEDKLKGDPRTNLDRAREAAVQPEFEPAEVEIAPDIALVVDAVLGTGASGALREPCSTWAAVCSARGVPVVAIDAPSGVDLATGRVEGPAFRAVATAALAEYKTGYFTYPGRAFAGRIYRVDIGIPAEAAARVDSQLHVITPAGVRQLLPGRLPDAHKGTYGRMAVIGGSTGMTGAVILASRAALRTGCGLAYLGVPRSLNAICETAATEVVTRPLPELRHGGALAVRSLGDALGLAGDTSACVLGCGAGRHHETRELVARLVEQLATPLVLDADGLFGFADDQDRLVRHRAPLIITPHPGELAHLLGTTVEGIQADRIGSALRAARHFDCVCVLKGAATVVATVTGQAYVNPSGNSGMATAGSGDVLAGMIGSLVAQGASMLGAATAGVYLHGRAGDIAAAEHGERGLIASDILDSVPEAIRRTETGAFPDYL